MVTSSVSKPTTDQRNPLIDSDPSETAENIRNAVAFLSLTSCASDLTEEALDGRRLLLEVVEHAAKSLSETLQANGANHG